MSIALLPFDDAVPIVLNPRLTRVLGRAKHRGEKNIVVEIAKNVYELADEQTIKNVICHELLHTAFPLDGHLGQWKFYANKANILMPKYNITRCNTDKELYKRRHKWYKVKCLKCGEIWETHNKTCVKYPERYYHVTCGGNLTILDEKGKQNDKRGKSK